ncbi:MAG TPA: hypothetical protein VEH84_00690 [Alphaproteobacteria bacterium]|nr:hypothetical protein [Alphaproteobacteria bacterium]
MKTPIRSAGLALALGLAAATAFAQQPRQAQPAPRCAAADKACQQRAQALQRERTSQEAERLRALDRSAGSAANRASDDALFSGPTTQQRLDQGLGSGLSDFKSDLQRMESQRSALEDQRRTQELQLNGVPGPLLLPPP